MITQQLKSMSPSLFLKRIALGISLVSLLNACGGGGATTDANNGPGPAVSATGLRALPAALTTRQAVSYSPYTTVNGAALTDNQVLQDLQLLVQAGFGLIRLFDSSDNLAARTLRVISANNLDIKVQLGSYMNSFEYLTDPVTRLSVQQANQDEMARTIHLANQYPNIVAAVSVGNETMVTWSIVPVSTGTMASYIRNVRSQIQQPVTTDDNFAFYAGYARDAAEQAAQIFREIDYASIHSYAIEDAYYNNPSSGNPLTQWDWEQLGVTDTTQRAAAMMDAALGKLKADYNLVQSYMQQVGYGNLPILIGETGWKAQDPSGTNRYRFLASPVNQLMYYSRILDWTTSTRNGTGPKNIFYFEAFDETWKGGDDNWGLFNVSRQARCAIKALNPSANWTMDPGSSSCGTANAVYYVPLQAATAVSGSLTIFNQLVHNWPAGLRADKFQSGTFNLMYPATGDAPANDLAAGGLAASYYLLLDTFTPANYGWGLLWHSTASPAVSTNLSNFANGNVQFSIRTTYAGSLTISVGSDSPVGVQQASINITTGSYGYANDGSWHDVTIPVSAFIAANPLFDPSYVLTPFTISDVWTVTGNTARTGMPPIHMDNIRWTP